MLFFSGCKSQVRVDRLEKLNSVSTWWCYYGADRRVFNSNKDLFVLDHSAIGKIESNDINRPLCLAYLSVGELDTQREESKHLRGADFVLQSNEVWSDARLIDVRSKKWQEFILQCASEKMKLGYDGFFLDTIDSVERVLKNEPSEYKGIIQSLITLVAKIRKLNPEALIIANGGSGISTELAPYIDAWCFESVENTYDFTKRKYRVHASDDQQWVDMRIRVLKETGLPIFALDYSDSEELVHMKKSLIDRGLIPAITTISLQELPK